MKYLLYALFLILCICSFVTGSQENNSSDNIREIQIGAVLPLDGQWASLGNDSEVALNLAMDTLNDYLKPYNLKVILDIENSSSDPDKALEALKTLNEKGVKAVVGPCSSAEAAKMVPYANENDIVLLSPSSTAFSLTQDDNLFRLAPNDTNQADALAQLIKRQNITQVLFVYVNDEYGSGMYKCLKEKSSDVKYGFQIINSVSFDSNISNFDPLVQNISAASTELSTDTGAIILIGSDSQAIGIFTSAGLNSPLSEYKWLSGDGVIDQAGILKNDISAEFAAKTRLEGFAYACEETLTVVPTMMTASLMSKELGTAPSPGSLLVWDALWCISEAYRLNPDANIDEFKSNLKYVLDNSVNVFGQVVKLDDNGDVKTAKYAHFLAVKGNNGEVYWNLEGMYIHNTVYGAFITDANGNYSRDSAEIIIGSVLPLSGSEEEKGIRAKEAIELALKQGNDYYTKTEGLNNHYSIDFRDSASDPETALSQVKALHEAGINIIVMGGNSAEISAVQDYCRENNIIVLCTRSTAVELANSDDLIYRLSPDDSNQAKALVQLMEKQGKKHLVVLFRDDVYGQGLESNI